MDCEAFRTRSGADRPPAPRNVRVGSITPYELTVKWDAPRYCGADIVDYEISLRISLVAKGAAAKKNMLFGGGVEKKFKTGNGAASYTILGLTPSTTIEGVRVRGRNSEGWGHKSWPALSATTPAANKN